MRLSFTEKKNIRKNFGKLKETLTIPNLIEIQKKSYNEFLSQVALSSNKSRKVFIPDIFNFYSIFTMKYNIHYINHISY